MSKNRHLTYLPWLPLCMGVLIYVVFQTSALASTDFDNMLKRGDLAVNIKVIDQSIVPKQQTTVEVEIKSALPFSGQLTLPYIDIKDAVVAKQKPQITGSTYQADGKNWFVKKIQFHVFPLQQGQFQIPSFNLDVELKTSPQHNSKGRISTPATAFDVSLPQALHNQKSYVVGSDATLTLATDKPMNQAFSAGDAVVLTYQLKVKNSDIVVLPELLIPNIQGVDIYPKPVAKENVFDRLSKRNTATLTQVVTLVFQQSGKLTLPGQSVKWWDNKTQTEHTLSTDTLTIQIGEDTRSINAQPTSFLPQLSRLQWLYIGIGLMITASVIVLSKRYMTSRAKAKRQLQPATNQPDLARHKKQIISAVQAQHYPLAVEHIYHYANCATFEARLDTQSREIWDQLLQLSYSDNAQCPAITLQQIETLLSAISAPAKAASSGFRFDLRLNP
ncbi:hypothetical protein [Vibrio gallicus]|uniref:hypothetical protein n=1 Tax=Vibrio gallicus TaxID=190897 RepID=UPI0021C45AD1|nr:hypothetical protein [Vibrio gallicus]